MLAFILANLCFGFASFCSPLVFGAGFHRGDGKPFLVCGLCVALHFLQLSVAGKRRDLVDRAIGLGELTTWGLAQAMRR